ncbi:hypothetical protein [Alloprevotella tannerae]|nr:hypothetical protein [Alloprevotella tannerae]
MLTKGCYDSNAGQAIRQQAVCIKGWRKGYEKVGMKGDKRYFVC